MSRGECAVAHLGELSRMAPTAKLKGGSEPSELRPQPSGDSAFRCPND